MCSKMIFKPVEVFFFFRKKKNHQKLIFKLWQLPCGVAQKLFSAGGFRSFGSIFLSKMQIHDWGFHMESLKRHHKWDGSEHCSSLSVPLCFHSSIKHNDLSPGSVYQKHSLHAATAFKLICPQNSGSYWKSFEKSQENPNTKDFSLIFFFCCHFCRFCCETSHDCENL